MRPSCRPRHGAAASFAGWLLVPVEELRERELGKPLCSRSHVLAEGEATGRSPNVSSTDERLVATRSPWIFWTWGCLVARGERR